VFSVFIDIDVIKLHGITENISLIIL